MVELAHTLTYGLLAVLLFCIIAFIYWTERRYKDNKAVPDPIQKGIVISFLVVAVFFLAEAVGFLEKGWNQKNFWIHLLLVFIIVSLYLLVAYRKKAKTFIEQEKKVRQLVFGIYNAEEYKGQAYVPFLVAYKVAVENEDKEATRGEIGNFLVLAKSSKLIYVWVQLNIYTLQELHIQYDPPQEKLLELYGKRIPTADKFVEQFEEKEEDGKPNPQPT